MAKRKVFSAEVQEGIERLKAMPKGKLAEVAYLWYCMTQSGEDAGETPVKAQAIWDSAVPEVEGNESAAMQSLFGRYGVTNGSDGDSDASGGGSRKVKRVPAK